MDARVGIIGGGPAGLTAAYLLSKNGVPATLFETDPNYLGGISRTVRHNGFHFDIGGHRFFSKSQRVEDLWTEILGPDLLVRPRSSRIYYRGKFYSYPLKAFEALRKLGLVEAGLCAASYMQARLRPHPDPKSLQDWVTNEFGERLFRIFFKTYTEKVWGVDCREISADWAAQRIKGLSLGSAIANALMPERLRRKKSIKTLIESFRYPRQGPGMLWERCGEKIRAFGGEIRLGQHITRCALGRDGRWTVATPTSDVLACDHVISSAPIRELVASLQPAPSQKACQAASHLKYRDFVTVALMVRDSGDITDNWIYIHDAAVKAGRVQNYKSWSPEMVPDPALACYGLEYFCNEGDETWTAADADLIALAKQEIDAIGIVRAADIIDGCVVRQLKAYPVYDDEYRDHVELIRDEIERDYPGLHLVGRNGMHKYNNQDHAMMTATLTVENILAGRKLYDVWKVNQDAEYHESGERG